MCKRQLGGKPIVIKRNILEATRSGEDLALRR
jgi:hypothetical protein